MILGGVGTAAAAAREPAAVRGGPAELRWEVRETLAAAAMAAAALERVTSAADTAALTEGGLLAELEPATAAAEGREEDTEREDTTDGWTLEAGVVAAAGPGVAEVAGVVEAVVVTEGAAEAAAVEARSPASALSLFEAAFVW